MPLYTGPQLVAEVRDYADEPDDGAPDDSYVTDAMIYRRLNNAYKRSKRHLLRAGSFFKRASTTSTTATATLSGVPEVIYGVYYTTDNVSYRQLARKVDGAPPYVRTGAPVEWSAVLDDGGQCIVTVSPTPSQGTWVVYYADEDTDISSATTGLYLSTAWKDVVVLEAALRCFARADGSNHMLQNLYTQALEDFLADISQFTDAGVIRNTDDVYTPGENNSSQANIDSYWWAPA